MNIYLLRHGETDWNQEGRLQGHTDIPLNQNGRIQINYAAEVLTNLHVGIDLIISSPLSRAYESAGIVAERLSYEKDNIIIEPLLIERCFGVGEGLTIVERQEKYPNDIYPEMESYEDLIERAHSVFDKIVRSYKDSENVLVVAHGAILYAMLTAITDGKIIYGGKMVKLDQASVHLIKYIDGAIQLTKYNEESSMFTEIKFNTNFLEDER